MSIGCRKIGILLINDQVLFRMALAELFSRQPDMYVVQQAGTIAEATTWLTDQTPDVILLDYDLVGELASELFEKAPGLGARIPIIAFSSRMSTASMERLYRLGTTAILWKTATPDDFIRDIRLSLRRWRFYQESPPKIEQPTLRASTLTVRQAYVAAAVLRNTPLKIIAADMGVTESTVKSTLKVVYQKREPVAGPSSSAC